MNSVARATEYGQVASTSIVMGASSHELIEVLFKELNSALVAADFFATKGDPGNTRKSLNKACRILGGLQGSLDFQKGGEIAINLAELYRFCVKELFKANASIDPDTINKVRDLITPISEAWSQMPASYKNQPPQND